MSSAIEQLDQRVDGTVPEVLLAVVAFFLHQRPSQALVIDVTIPIPVPAARRPD
jgi:hypothetical protein